MSMFLLLLKSLPALVPFIAEIIKQKSNGGVPDRRAKNPLVPWLVITVFLLLSSLAYGITFMSEHSALERKLTLENAKLLQDYQGEKAETADLREQSSFLKRQLLEKDELLGSLRSDKRDLSNQISTLNTRLTEFGEDLFKASSDAKEARAARAELERRLTILLDAPRASTNPVVMKQQGVSKSAKAALETLAAH